MHNDVIAIGYRRGVDIHLACSDAGLTMVPEPTSVGRKNPASGWYDVLIAATVPNVVALRMMNVITAGDAIKIMKGENHDYHDRYLPGPLPRRN